MIDTRKEKLLSPGIPRMVDKEGINKWRSRGGFCFSVANWFVLG